MILAQGEDGATHTLVVVVGLRREARIAAFPGLRVIIGGGRGRELAAALDEALAVLRKPAVLSFGVAGALFPDHKVGDVVVPDEIVTPSGDRLLADASWTARLRAAARAAPGAILGVDHVIAGVADKARLWATEGARAVDMESHVVAAAAARCGAPFAALRVISDRADHLLPVAATVGLRADGGVDAVAVLRRLVTSPAELPALLRTARDAASAFRKLAHVRRDVGNAFAMPEQAENPSAGLASRP